MTVVIEQMGIILIQDSALVRLFLLTTVAFLLTPKGRQNEAVYRIPVFKETDHKKHKICSCRIKCSK